MTYAPTLIPQSGDKRLYGLAVANLAQRPNCPLAHIASPIPQGRIYRLGNLVSNGIQILDQAEESALVLCPTNTREPAFICSCCGCCCGILRSLKSLPNPGEVVASSFRAGIDSDLCSACGECLERCQMEAIVEGDEFMEVNRARCIGCGLCLAACPEEAVSLHMKPETVAPPTDWDETMARILQERGLA